MPWLFSAGGLFGPPRNDDRTVAIPEPPASPPPRPRPAFPGPSPEYMYEINRAYIPGYILVKRSSLPFRITYEESTLAFLCSLIVVSIAVVLFRFVGTQRCDVPYGPPVLPREYSGKLGGHQIPAVQPGLFMFTHADY